MKRTKNLPQLTLLEYPKNKFSLSSFKQERKRLLYADLIICCPWAPQYFRIQWSLFCAEEKRTHLAFQLHVRSVNTSRNQS